MLLKARCLLSRTNCAHQAAPRFARTASSTSTRRPFQASVGGPAREARSMDMSSLHYATLLEVAALIKVRDLSPVELPRHMLGRIDAVDPSLHAYLAVTGKSAVAEAEQAEAELRSGRCRGPLHGVPIA